MNNIIIDIVRMAMKDAIPAATGTARLDPDLSAGKKQCLALIADILVFMQVFLGLIKPSMPVFTLLHS